MTSQTGIYLVYGVITDVSDAVRSGHFRADPAAVGVQSVLKFNAHHPKPNSSVNVTLHSMRIEFGSCV